MRRGATEFLKFQEDYSDRIVSAQNSPNRQIQKRLEKAFTACIRGEVEKEAKINAKALGATAIRPTEKRSPKG